MHGRIGKVQERTKLAQFVHARKQGVLAGSARNQYAVGFGSWVGGCETSMMSWQITA